MLYVKHLPSGERNDISQLCKSFCRFVAKITPFNIIISGVTGPKLTKFIHDVEGS